MITIQSLQFDKKLRINEDGFLINPLTDELQAFFTRETAIDCLKWNYKNHKQIITKEQIEQQFIFHEV